MSVSEGIRRRPVRGDTTHRILKKDAKGPTPNALLGAFKLKGIRDSQKCVVFKPLLLKMPDTAHSRSGSPSPCTWQF